MMEADFIAVRVCDNGGPAPITVLRFHFYGDIGLSQLFYRSLDILHCKTDNCSGGLGTAGLLRQNQRQRSRRRPFHKTSK